MSYAFPPPLDRLVREVLAAGAYRSEDDLLLEAVQVLRERDEAVAGIREGLADLEAGRTRTLREVDDELRKKHSLSRSA
jgi:predicted transcriptional regulator